MIGLFVFVLMIRKPFNDFDKPIDIVYTWVNGTDEEWKVAKQYWYSQTCGEKQLHIEENARYVDHDELRYSLRSIMSNIPWIRHIFIVTAGQRPSWLDTTGERISIIYHSDIMPSSALPTFNSEAIELNLHRIPGLSDHFLYSNDDCFILRSTLPSFFFTMSGEPKYSVGIKDVRQVDWQTLNYTRTLMYTAKRFELATGKFYGYEPSHNIIPYRKRDFLECEMMFKSEFNFTIHQKIRTAGSIQRSIISYYSVHFSKAQLNLRRDTLYLPIRSPHLLKTEIRNKKPTLLCINDEETCSNHDRLLLPSFLHELFPVSSEFEQ